MLDRDWGDTEDPCVLIEIPTHLVDALTRPQGPVQPDAGHKLYMLVPIENFVDVRRELADEHGMITTTRMNQAILTARKQGASESD